MLLLVLLVLHVHARPFARDEIDTLEIFSLAGSMLYALCGMLFYPSITMAAQGLICTEGMEGSEERCVLWCLPT